MIILKDNGQIMRVTHEGKTTIESHICMVDELDEALAYGAITQEEKDSITIPEV